MYENLFMHKALIFLLVINKIPSWQIRLSFVPVRVNIF